MRIRTFVHLAPLLYLLLLPSNGSPVDLVEIIGRYLGCYQNFSTTEQFTGTTMSFSACIDLCYNNSFAALKKSAENGDECHCGEEFQASDMEINCDVMVAREPKWGLKRRHSFSVFSTCRVGYYGDQCSHECSRCLSAIPCQRTTGNCYSGCDLRSRDKRCTIASRLNEVNVAQNKIINYDSPEHRNRLENNCTPLKNVRFHFDFGHKITIRNGIAVFKNIRGGFNLFIFQTKYLYKPLYKINISTKNGFTFYNFTNDHNHDGKFLTFQYSRKEFKNELICKLEVFARDCKTRLQCKHNEECMQLFYGTSSFRRCVCQKGFNRKSLAHDCEERSEYLNDCDLDLQKCNNETSTCRNTETGYTCDCQSGFKKNRHRDDKFSCTDIDECSSKKQNICDQKTTICNNTFGGYECLCRRGFKPFKDDAFPCTDVDECSDEELNRCDIKSTICENKFGTYACSCKTGFSTIDGNPFVCKDIDECVLDKSVCNLTSTDCINEAGTFSCKCKNGFKPSPKEKYLCEDVDECLNLSLFNINTTECSNLYGSYKLSCRVGYYNHTDEDAFECRGITGISSSIGLISLILLSVVVVIVLLLLIWQQIKKKRIKFSLTPKAVGDDNKSLSPQHTMTKIIYDEKGETFRQVIEIAHNTRISMDDLDQYIEDAYNVETDGFKSEFETIPKSFDKSSTYSKLELTKSKNRYKNIYPYDDNRVILSKQQDDPTSDYINASFIKDRTNEDSPIIVTQGPLKETVDDFWRMIAEQNVSLIVMLTKIVESDNIKCYKYWPDVDSRIYGDFVVTKLSETNWKNYCRRTFALSGNIRNSNQALSEINHWQFLSWSDHGIPDEVDSFLEFLGKIRKSRNRNEGMVVHCSAGAGRAGCFIAIENLLKEAATEGSVDVASCVKQLRQQRPYMVQSLKQYQFIYAVLKRSKSWVDSCISIKDFHLELSERSTGDSLYYLSDEFTKLVKEVPLDDEDIFISDSFLLRPHNRIFEAMEIHGYSNTSQFIVGNYPEEWDVEGFWKIIQENACLVLLVDHDGVGHPNFIPDKSHPLHLKDDLFISLNQVENHKFGSVHRINIDRNRLVTEHVYENTGSVTIENGERRKCTVVRASSSAHASLSWEFFCQVRDHVIKLALEEQLSVLFVAGKAGCPLASYYVACSILFEQMDEHEEVDIYKTILKLREAGIAREFGIIQYEELYQLIDVEIHHRMDCMNTSFVMQRFSTISRC